MKKIIQSAVVLTCLFVLAAGCKRGSNSAAPQEEKYAVVSAAGGLNMRSAPTVSAEKIITIPAGSRVKIVSLSDKKERVGKTVDFWAQVVYEGKQGWVFNGFLGQEPAPSAGMSAACQLEVRSQAMKDYVEGLAKKQGLQIPMGDFSLFIHTAVDGGISYKCHVVCGEGCENPPTCEITRMIFEDDKIVLHIVENKSVQRKCVAGKSVFTDPGGEISCGDL